jgi:hypothetical protein
MHNPTATPRTEQTLQSPPLQSRPLVDLHVAVLDHHVHHRPERALEGVTRENGGDAEGGGGLVPALRAVADVELCGGRGWG